MNSKDAALHVASEQPTHASILVFAAAVAASGLWLFIGSRLDRPQNLVDRPSAQQAAELTTGRLLALSESAVVCREILRRDSVPSDRLQHALLVLARQQRRPELQLLIELTQRLPPDADVVQTRNYIRLFADIASSGRRWKDEIRKLVHHPSPATRQVAMATAVLVDDQLATTWEMIELPERRCELIQALPLVESGPLQEVIYDDIHQLIRAPRTDDRVRRAAICILPQTVGRQSDKTTDLIWLLNKRVETITVLQAVANTVPEAWSDDQVSNLTSSLVAIAAETTSSDRTTEWSQTVVCVGQKLAQNLTPVSRKRFLERLNELSVKIH